MNKWREVDDYDDYNYDDDEGPEMWRYGGVAGCLLQLAAPVSSNNLKTCTFSVKNSTERFWGVGSSVQSTQKSKLVERIYS